jgi:hypothetical protein
LNIPVNSLQELLALNESEVTRFPTDTKRSGANRDRDAAAIMQPANLIFDANPFTQGH